MIYGFLHQGSGVGNQLHRMVATRVKALDLGVDWRMIYMPDGSGKPEGFKCKDFMEFDESKMIQADDYDLHLGLNSGDIKRWEEKKVIENGVDIRGYDPEINFVPDNTVIDGEFQDERYFEHRLDEIGDWLEVEPLEMPDDVCVIGFRGGEYKMFPDLFLPKQYWDKAILAMKLEYGDDLKFEIHTDDPETAKQFFPDFPVIHDVGTNWRAVRYAKHLIIANSSFYILPALLNEDVKEVIAPRYFARRNTKVWALPQNFYKKFLYL